MNIHPFVTKEPVRSIKYVPTTLFNIYFYFFAADITKNFKCHALFIAGARENKRDSIFSCVWISNFERVLCVPLYPFYYEMMRPLCTFLFCHRRTPDIIEFWQTIWDEIGSFIDVPFMEAVKLYRLGLHDVDWFRRRVRRFILPTYLQWIFWRRRNVWKCFIIEYYLPKH